MARSPVSFQLFSVFVREFTPLDFQSHHLVYQRFRWLFDELASVNALLAELLQQTGGTYPWSVERYSGVYWLCPLHPPRACVLKTYPRTSDPWLATPSPPTSLTASGVDRPFGLVPFVCWPELPSRRRARTSTSSLVLGKRSRGPRTRRSKLKLLFSFLIGFGLSLAGTYLCSR